MPADNKTIRAGNEYLPRFGTQFYQQESQDANMKNEMADRLRRQMFETEAGRQNALIKQQMDMEAMQAEYALKQKLAATKAASGGGGGAAPGGSLAMTPSEFQTYVSIVAQTDPDAALRLAQSATRVTDKYGKVTQYGLPATQETLPHYGQIPQARKGTAPESAWDENFAERYAPNVSPEM